MLYFPTAKTPRNTEKKVEVLDKDDVKSHHQNEASFYEGLAKRRADVISF